MSMHRQNDVPELTSALNDHHLATDTPSISSDAFRLGWAAAQAQLNSPAHAAKVLLGDDDVAVSLAKKSAARSYDRGYKTDPAFTMQHSGTCDEYVHNNWEKYLQDAEGAIMDLRAIALDTTTATCDDTREGE